MKGILVVRAACLVDGVAGHVTLPGVSLTAKKGRRYVYQN